MVSCSPCSESSSSHWGTAKCSEWDDGKSSTPGEAGDHGSPPETSGVDRANPCSTFEKTTWRPAARADDGNVAPIGRPNQTITQYRAVPGNQLAKAGDRQRGAAWKKSLGEWRGRRTRKVSARPNPSRRTKR